MAVRFTSHGSGADAPEPERTDLAEVVDLRSRLAHKSALPGSGETPVRRSAGASNIAPVTRLGASHAEVADNNNNSGRESDNESGSGGEESGGNESGGNESAVTALSDVPEDMPVTEDRPVRTVTEDGVRLLARKARSSGELRRELIRLGHEAHDVDAAILEFETSLYLDDLGLARVFVEKLRDRKRASRMQIRMKLRERSLPDGVIEEALGELDDDEEIDLLRTTAADRARRLTELDRATAERRLLGFLARRGWSGDQAFRAAREALDGIGSKGEVRFR